MAKKKQDEREKQQEQLPEQQEQQQERPTWQPVNLKDKGMAQAASFGGLQEVLMHKSGAYSLVKKMDRQWNGGRYRYKVRWHLRKGAHMVHEVMPRESLEVAKQEAEAYIAEAEEAAQELKEERAVELDGAEMASEETAEGLPEGMTEEQFNKSYEDEE